MSQKTDSGNTGMDEQQNSKEGTERKGETEKFMMISETESQESVLIPVLI